MSIIIRCPGCQKSITALSKYAGRIVACPGCKTKLKIPGERATANAPKTSAAVPNKKVKQTTADSLPTKKTQAFKILIPANSGSEDARPGYASITSRLAGRSGASNPGRIPINPIHYSLRRPLWPCVLAVACCVGIVLAAIQIKSGETRAANVNKSNANPSVDFMEPAAHRFESRGAQLRNEFRSVTQTKAPPVGKPTGLDKDMLGRVAMLSLFPIGLTLLYFYDRFRHFMRGDGNPGIVLALNPTLVAVATDMSKDDEPFRAVKVFETNLKTWCGMPLEVGSVIGTIAQYSGAAGNQGHFADFNPLPATLATNNEAHLLSLVDSFDRDQYQQSSNGIKRLQQPYRPGLFYVGGQSEAEEMPKGLFATIQAMFKRKSN